MALVPVHSHLLLILLTSYFNLLIFVIVGGQKAFFMFAGGMSGKSAAQLQEQFEALKVLISFSLHCATLICIILCIIFNVVDKIKSKIPPVVVIVILIFTLIFNLIGAILLLVYKQKDEQSVLLAGGIVSIIAALIVIAVMLYFIRWPPQAQIVIQEFPLAQKQLEQRNDMPGGQPYAGGPANAAPGAHPIASADYFA